MPGLEDLFVGLPFAVVGGTAAASYMPKRFTDDIDVLWRAADLPSARQLLRAAGAEPVGPLSLPVTPLQIRGEAWLLRDGVALDVRWSPAPWVDRAIAGAVPDPAGLPIIGLPFLVLMKLDASRSIDLGDLTRMLGGASDADLTSVRDAIATYLPDAASDLESLIYLGRLEFESPE